MDNKLDLVFSIIGEICNLLAPEWRIEKKARGGRWIALFTALIRRKVNPQDIIYQVNAQN